MSVPEPQILHFLNDSPGPRFHTRMVTRDLEDDLYELVGDLVYDSDVLRARLVIPSGFVFDRMSITRWVPVIYALMGNRAGAAGAVHDFLYQTHRFSRALCDLALPEAMACLGQPPWRCRAAYLGVRAGGMWAYASGPERYRRLQLDIQGPPPPPGDVPQGES